MSGNVVFIGFSGTGKSLIGRSLAARLGWTFVDTDSELVRRFDKSIDRVFAEDGEPAFRDAERETLVKACAGSRRVISVGGGAVVDPTNRSILNNSNLIVRLEATPEAILRRLRAEQGTEVRPLLQVADPLERIRSLKASREPYYAIAQLVVDTEQLSLAEVVAVVAAEVCNRGLH